MNRRKATSETKFWTGFPCAGEEEDTDEGVDVAEVVIEG